MTRFLAVAVLLLPLGCATTPINRFEQAVHGYNAALEAGITYYETTGPARSDMERGLVKGLVHSGRILRVRGQNLIEECIRIAPPDGKNCPSGSSIRSAAGSLAEITSSILDIVEEN